MSRVKPCASPVGIRTEYAAERMSWSIFPNSAESIFVSGLPIMCATAQTD